MSTRRRTRRRMDDKYLSNVLECLTRPRTRDSGTRSLGRLTRRAKQGRHLLLYGLPGQARPGAISSILCNKPAFRQRTGGRDHPQRPSRRV